MFTTIATFVTSQSTLDGRHQPAGDRATLRGRLDGKNPNTAEELVHDAYIIHDRELAEELQGPELYNALASSTRELFSDLTFTSEDVVAAGDEVALRWTMVGTHDGPLFGVEPTGERVELTAIEIDRFEGGQLIETWTQSDQLSLMEQVGAV